MAGHTSAEFSSDIDDYAAHVASNALQNSPKGIYWYGGSSTMIWAVKTFLWSTAWDYVFPKMFGLADMKQKIKAEGQRRDG